MVLHLPIALYMASIEIDCYHVYVENALYQTAVDSKVKYPAWSESNA